MFVLGAGHMAVENFTGINIREQYLQQYLKFWFNQENPDWRWIYKNVPFHEQNVNRFLFLVINKASLFIFPPVF